MAKKSLSLRQQPHAVCVPYPTQGHINPMLKLAKLLHSRGFHVTFVNTEFNHRRLIRSRGPTAVEGLPSFRFETIPDGLEMQNDQDATQDITELCRSTEFNCLGHFRELLRRLNRRAEEEDGGPPVSCVVSDTAMFFTLDAAQELGIPEVMFWTASACGFLGCAQFDKLVELGLVPFKDANFLTNGDLDKTLDWVPAMEGIRLKDIPTFMRTTNPDEFMLCHLQRVIQNTKRASAILFNTFDALEHDVLEYLSSVFPPIYPVGPIHFLLEPSEASKNETKSIETNLWKEDPHCLAWLDSHEPNSVVYVNFGSITVMTMDQLVEFVWGLADSHCPFLWINRPDLVTGESTALPQEFLEETRDRGRIASWCNQEQVLAHQAIGGYLTHCGWNSTIESISNGVPMIIWPFFAEQQTNCWFSCKKWGIGMEIDANVRRSEVERQVRELMGGEKGKEMRKKALEWKKLAQEATFLHSGSSYSSFDHVITKILNPQASRE